MSEYNGRPLQIAVLIKQIPRTESLDLNASGYLQREGVAVEINPYCRRALTQGVLLTKASGGECHVFCMGPETAEHALREALAAGANSAVLISDKAMAGSDTLATAKTLYAALSNKGRYDLVLTGLNSVDADTGQVPGQLAQLLDYPFLSGVKKLDWSEPNYSAWLEQDRKGITMEFSLPCLISTAERLCDPIKPTNAEINAIERDRVEHLSAKDLGEGPWGQDLSPTQVGEMKKNRHPHRCGLRFEGTDPIAVAEAVSRLEYWGALSSPEPAAASKEPSGFKTEQAIQTMAVIVEPGEWRWGKQLCAKASRLARRVVVILCEAVEEAQISQFSADAAVILQGVNLPEQAASGVLQWLQQCQQRPDSIIGNSSQWGRHVLSRLAAATNSGLTGDATDLGIDADGRLLAAKPAFCGKLTSYIVCSSSMQMATVREGVFQNIKAVAKSPATIEYIAVSPADNGLRLVQIEELDQPIDLYSHSTLVGIGQGVDPDDYALLHDLKGELKAEFVATRKVTDYGWLPRARQVGLTGKTIAPSLYIAVALSGRPYHAISIQNSRWIVAINNDPYAPIFDQADICLIGDWKQVVTQLLKAIRQRKSN